jgi:hypothetical protein
LHAESRMLPPFLLVNLMVFDQDVSEDGIHHVRVRHDVELFLIITEERLRGGHDGDLLGLGNHDVDLVPLL